MVPVAIAVGALLLLGFSPQVASASKKVDCPEGSTGGLNLNQGKCVKFKKAKLVKGMAFAPTTAPERVKRVVAAANEIRTKPYVYGGGHGSFNSKGYDCSGAVSYALRGGNFLSSPLNSTGFKRWGKKGIGKWITVYTNPSHAYMVVAGLRFDTSRSTDPNAHPGSGPRWSTSMRSTKGVFEARSPAGF